MRPWALELFRRFNPWSKRSASEAREHAQKLIAKAEARKSVQGLLTPAQEELRRELGLHPGGYEKNVEGKPVKKAKDPLTKRQRALLQELGLEKKPDSSN
jgi:hypothetical protein